MDRVEIIHMKDSLLLELHLAHERVLGAMEVLGRLTRECAPNEDRLSNARWKLSAASMHRRLLVRTIHDRLAPSATMTEAVDLRRLQILDAEIRQASTDHISNWTTSAILLDWPGYCEASIAIRGEMIGYLEEEKRVLNPMLRFSRTSPQRHDDRDRPVAA